MTNNVQTLDKKRGRPKSYLVQAMRNLYPELSSRQSINNKQHMHQAGLSARGIGLVDSNFRDKETGKRLLTKLSELGKLFGDDFFQSDNGKNWLSKNWSAIVDMTTAEFIAWAKTVKNGDNTP